MWEKERRAAPSTDLHPRRPHSPLEAVCATRYAVADFDKERPVTAAKTRTETDTFGPIEVAADRYWG
ncbi:class II fumarate hydratase, partial [Mesorhizobium sp. M7A.F.Ca.US.007.01.1.1]